MGNNLFKILVHMKDNLKEKWARKLIREFIEPFREASKTTLLSTNSNCNHMGCSSPSLDDLHNEDECFQENGVSRLEKVSLQDARKNKIYVWEFNLHVRKEQPVNSIVEGEFYTNTTVVPFKCCPNKERIQLLLPYLGKLCRNDTLTGHAWTKEELKTLCHLVVPDIQCIRERISKTMSPVPEGEEQDEHREVSNNSRIRL
ncbi:1638_t:CDS:2 [Funneliformis mosseae]|uniref:1638_t:CDS:1 n=1 Tax=Funneliformis mosseae TaxID=27381 RepID=A0A9N9G8Z8_FUNMO|nr:1638_t:CDS:2 [Funneliformis mosseae]